MANSYLNNAVYLKGNGHVQEAIAGGTITPGMLITIDSDLTVIANADAAAVVPQILFAVEDELQGNEITDNYSAADIVKYVAPQRGDEVGAIASAAIAVGAIVESTGNGKVRTRTTGKALGQCLTVADADGDRFVLQIN